MSRKLWVAVPALGVAMIPVGVIWMIYAIAQTDPTTRGTSGSDSVWSIVAFFVAFIGGILITAGMLGWMFSWFSGDDEDDGRPSPSDAFAHAVPTTRVGWGGDAPGNSPGGS